MIVNHVSRKSESVIRGHWWTAICAVLLTGCAVHLPEYKRPELDVKSSWSRQTPAAVSASEAIKLQWWEEFRDPYLNTLVDKAIASNFDMKILAARTGVAEAQIAEARAGALPTLDVGAGAAFEKSTRQKFSKQFNLAAQVNWEIDIWGKVAKGVQATNAEFLATEADWRAGYLTLVSDVST